MTDIGKLTLTPSKATEGDLSNHIYGILTGMETCGKKKYTQATGMTAEDCQTKLIQEIHEQ